MERQNITLSLPRTLLKKAKIIAAKREKSLSELLRESLEEKIEEETGYQKAKERHAKLLMTGFNLGTKGHFKVSREELHERR
jgi:metal-responsive CopG/Arc/MetJ family transcriptional regulator